jgi:hypothetical protein
MKTLLENPIILVILVGIISSFFKKVKSQQENGEKGKPNPVRIPQVKIEPVRRNKKQRRNSEGLGEQPYPQRKPANIQNERNNRLEQEATLKSNQKIVPAKKVIEDDNKVQIDTERLIDGIIWSEVLGPPRSKRPHRSIRNN